MGFTLLGILSGSAAAGGSPPIAGYLVGGYRTGATSDIEKLDFATETTAYITALPNVLVDSVGFANAGVAGYATSGQQVNTVLSTTHKFAFPTDSRSLSTNTLSRMNATGMSDSGTAGYLAGGDTGGNNTVNTIGKLTFATDAATTLVATLADAVQDTSSFSNKGAAGYVAGGRISQANPLATVNKLAFPADTRTTLATGLSVTKEFTQGFDDNGVAGYVGAGLSFPSFSNTIDKFSFADDSRTTLAAGLSSLRRHIAGTSARGIAGYFMGGQVSGVAQTTIDRFAFPTDTRSTLGTGLQRSLLEGGATFANQGGM